MKRAFPVILTALSLSALALLRTDGFSEDKIHGKLVDGASPPVSALVSTKLSQRYHYLARGRQCFVFASEDGQEVLKFLNYNRFFFPRWICSLPMPLSWRRSLESYAAWRQSRYEKTLDSLTLAYEKLAQETGIEYLHIQQGGSLPLIELLGPANRVRRIDLNSVLFVLQKRADTPIFEKLSSIAREQGEEGLCQALLGILSLLQKRCSLAIADDDRDIEINFGFAGDTPLLIDPGRIYQSEELKTKEGYLFEMQAATKKLQKWLRKHYPASAEWFEQVNLSH